MIDLFETPEKLPIEIIDLLNDFNQYENINRIKRKLF